ncbi:hypothetical protein BKA65DRAFT_411120, partial [Rhexocercosporidium sp. MPI-PUGE-AT-0058]
TTFLFKKNPFLILCLISYILTRAIRDNAVLVSNYTSAKLFFITDLRSQNIKAIKLKTEPIAYSKYAYYLNRLKRDAGFEDKLTSYYFRRGYINTIDSIYFILYY